MQLESQKGDQQEVETAFEKITAKTFLNMIKHKTP